MINETVMDYSWNSSYVLGSESGWEKTYLFTYFSQFDRQTNNFVIITEVAVMVVTFLVSLIANGSIVWCVIRFPDMQTVTNYFVLNLATADLLFAVTIPAVAYTRIMSSWNLGNFTCKFTPYMQFVSGVVLLWTLALISMDRHRCIVVPPYRSKLTPRQTVFLSLIIWFSTSTAFIPVFLWFREISTEGKTICTLVFPKSNNIYFSACFILPVIIFACLLPMVMLVYHYQRIFHKIISTKNTWASSCVMVSAIEVKNNNNQNRRQSEISMSEIFVPWPRRFSTQLATSPNGRQGSLSQHEEIRVNKHVKVVRILFLNVVVVLVMWLPITIVVLLIYIDGRRDDRNFFLRSHHFVAALIVAFLNTIVNPIVYGVLSDNFKTCLVRMWCGKKGQEVLVGINEPVTPSSGRHNGTTTKTTRKQSFINSVSEN